jgi:hypothetical protein
VVVDAAAVQRNRAYAAMMGYRPGSPVRDHGTDYEMPRRYLPSTPEAQAYIASAERDGEPQEDIARYRQRGVMLRPSEARRVLAGGAAGSQQIGATSRLIVARAASERSTAEAMA